MGQGLLAVDLKRRITLILKVLHLFIRYRNFLPNRKLLRLIPQQNLTVIGGFIRLIAYFVTSLKFVFMSGTP
jgi:hypothetical protein